MTYYFVNWVRSNKFLIIFMFLAFVAGWVTALLQIRPYVQSVERNSQANLEVAADLAGAYWQTLTCIRFDVCRRWMIQENATKGALVGEEFVFHNGTSRTFPRV